MTAGSREFDFVRLPLARKMGVQRIAAVYSPSVTAQLSLEMDSGDVRPIPTTCTGGGLAQLQLDARAGACDRASQM